MMWKVSSGAATVYLVGSMHLATPQMYPLPKEMEEAFDKSDVLVVEVNINKINQADMFKVVQEKGTYPEGETLSGHVSKDTMRALTDFCTKSGLPVAAIERMKPWVLSMTVEVLGITKLGLDPKLGIDKHFLDEADKAGKKIEELESADSQIDLLAGFDPKLQEKALVSALSEAKNLKELMGKLEEAWTTGNAQAVSDVIAKKLKDHPELKEIQKKMIDDRNGPMAEKVEAYLKGDKKVFVVAGVAHLVGDHGIRENASGSPLLRRAVERDPGIQAGGIIR